MGSWEGYMSYSYRVTADLWGDEEGPERGQWDYGKGKCYGDSEFTVKL